MLPKISKIRGFVLLICLGTMCLNVVAQTTLLSNFGQTDNWSVSLGNTSGSNWGHAWNFATGNVGYDLGSVTFQTRNNVFAVSDFTVAIYSSFSSSGPSDLVTTFSGSSSPSDGIHVYSTPVTYLTPNTEYWIVFTTFGSTSGTSMQLAATTSNSQDSSSAAGWSFGASRYTTINGSISWSEHLQPGDIRALITLTSVPEPSATVSLAGGIALLFGIIFKRLNRRPD